MNIRLVVLASLVLSGCQGLDLIPDVSPSGGGPEQSKKFLVDALNYWLGKPKEERVRVLGAPSQCAKVRDTQERCEWKIPTQQIVFLYDSKGIARSWSYRGDFGQFNNANHQMVKATAIDTNQSAEKQQKETDWVHPTKTKKELDQDYFACRDILEKDPKLAASTLGVRSGREYVSDESLETCLSQKGWKKN